MIERLVYHVAFGYYFAAEFLKNYLGFAWLTLKGRIRVTGGTFVFYHPRRADPRAVQRAVDEILAAEHHRHLHRNLREYFHG